MFVDRRLTRKKKFANLLNCSKMLMGKKLSSEYLEVRTRLGASWHAFGMRCVLMPLIRIERSMTLRLGLGIDAILSQATTHASKAR